MNIETYQDIAGAHRWRMVADNGRIVADSAEAYASRANVLRAAHRVVAAELVIIDRDEAAPR